MFRKNIEKICIYPFAYFQILDFFPLTFPFVIENDHQRLLLITTMLDSLFFGLLSGHRIAKFVNLHKPLSGMANKSRVTGWWATAFRRKLAPIQRFHENEDGISNSLHRQRFVASHLALAKPQFLAGPCVRIPSMWLRCSPCAGLAGAQVAGRVGPGWSPGKTTHWGVLGAGGRAPCRERGAGRPRSSWAVLDVTPASRKQLWVPCGGQTAEVAVGRGLTGGLWKLPQPGREGRAAAQNWGRGRFRPTLLTVDGVETTKKANVK